MSVFKKLFDRGQAGEPPEFATLLEQSMENLRFMTAHNQTWGIDKAERCNLDQVVGDLVFTFADGMVKAPAQIIGGFDTTTSIWQWAWANP